MTQEEINAAVDSLLASRSPKEVAALLDARDNLRLHNEEHAKTHPLDEVELTDEQWARFASHMLDGGGIRQDELPLDGQPSLRDQFHAALIEGDRSKAMHVLPHLVKAMMNRTGMRRVLRSGGVSTGWVGSNRTQLELKKGETQ